MLSRLRDILIRNLLLSSGSILGFHLAVVIIALMGCSTGPEESSISILNQPDSLTIYEIDSLNSEAFDLWNQDPKRGEILVRKSITKSKQFGYRKGLAAGLRTLGTLKWSVADYDSAMTYLIDAIGVYESLSDSFGIAKTNMTIGLIYDEQKYYGKALEYHNRALSFHRKLNDQEGVATVLNNIGAVYYWLDEYDKALLNYQEAFAIRKELRNKYGISESLNNIGLIYQRMNYIPLAREHYLKSLKLKEEISNFSGIVSTKRNLASLYALEKKYNQAKSLYREALSLSIEKGFRKWTKSIYYALSSMEVERGNHVTGLEYYKKASDLEREIFNEESTLKIAALESEVQLEKQAHKMDVQKKQIELLEKNNALRATWNIALASGIVVLLIISFLVYYQLKQRSRLKELKFKSDLDLKNKEISSYTLNFIQKNQMMEELKRQIQELRRSADIDTGRSLQKLNRIVDSTFKSDKEWENFRVTFDQMHDSFFGALKIAYSDLGNSELKLCALLRLNMNVKESAKILGISADSVKTARHRIRKKLGLKREDSLTDFLLRFEQIKLAS